MDSVEPGGLIDMFMPMVALLGSVHLVTWTVAFLIASYHIWRYLWPQPIRPITEPEPPYDYRLGAQQFYLDREACIVIMLGITEQAQGDFERHDHETETGGRWFTIRELTLAADLATRFRDIAVQEAGLTHTQWRTLFSDDERDFLYWFVLDLGDQAPDGVHSDSFRAVLRKARDYAEKTRKTYQAS